MLNKLGQLAWLYPSLILECLTLASSYLWPSYKEITLEVMESKAFELECQRVLFTWG